MCPRLWASEYHRVMPSSTSRLESFLAAIRSEYLAPAFLHPPQPSNDRLPPIADLQPDRACLGTAISRAANCLPQVVGMPTLREVGARAAGRRSIWSRPVDLEHRQALTRG